MEKEIAFFDLDGTLWNIKNEDVWIIDKEKPYKPVVILNNLEFSLIKAGKFVKDELPLEYNGQKYFISKDLFEIIKKKSGSENIERFGISLAGGCACSRDVSCLYASRQDERPDIRFLCFVYAGYIWGE